MDERSSDPSDGLRGSFETFRGVGAELLRQLGLTVEKTKLGVRSGLLRAIAWLWGALVVAAVTLLGLTRIFSGASAMVSAYTGWTWGADLTVGSAAVAAVVGFGAAVRWRTRRRGLRRLRAKYESEPSTSAAPRPAMEPQP